MPTPRPVRPIIDDDDTISGALEAASVAALLPAVAQLTGDHSLLDRVDLRPDPANVFDPEGGLTEAQVAEARELAFEALRSHRDRAGGEPEPETAPASPTTDQLLRLMAHIVGEANEADYFDLLREELAIGGEDLRAPQWHKRDIAPGAPFTVAIIGAGMSGILAAHRLRQAGVPFVVFEKNDDVGGTWFENTYPGCRVDVANHLYSYSFAPTTWPQHFSSQATLLDYFRSCADDFGVRPSIRFGTEVIDAVFDDDRSTWTLRVQASGGAEESIEVQAVVSAVGQLNRPKLPAIDGIESFVGESFHSAQWRHDVALKGRRVAVIGTGASAAQFVPIVSDDSGDLCVFQRTPNWLIPTPDYHDDVSPEMVWLLDHIPTYAQWYRLSLFWRTHEGLLPGAVVDPEWQPQTQSVSALNEMIRALLVDYLDTEFAGAPDLLAKVTPSYPPIAKRIIRDNGIWARTLRKDHVHLVADPIVRIAAEGVVTVDENGIETLHEVEVIIYGTGFDASHFLMPMRVVGRGGVDLHAAWHGDARAYLGMTIPGFPNLFCLYGPNTNIVINGSIIYFSECEVRYVVESVRMLLDGGHRSMECRTEVHDAFNERVDAANRTMAWGAAEVHSWYKNDSGRVAQNWPFSLLEYWQQSRTPNPADYDLR